MTKSWQESTHSRQPGNLSVNTILILSVLIAYNLPWIASGTAGLSLNAYDLAEWSSLHPSVVNMTPSLLTTFLLRLPLTCLTLIIAASTPQPPFRSIAWWMMSIIVLILTITLLPPLEFLSTDSSNNNYRQMFALSVFTGLFGISFIMGMGQRWQKYLIILLALMGLIVSIGGIALGINLYADFFLPRGIGIGALLTPALFGVIAIVTWRDSKTGQQ